VSTSDPAPPLDPPGSPLSLLRFDQAMHATAAIPVQSRLDLFHRLGSAQLCVGSAWLWVGSIPW
jgi:hypothetical protein